MIVDCFLVYVFDFYECSFGVIVLFVCVVLCFIVGCGFVGVWFEVFVIVLVVDDLV